MNRPPFILDHQQQSLNTHISGQYKHNMLQQIAVSIMLY